MDDPTARPGEAAPPLVIVGAGGHAAVAMETLRAAGRFRPVGWVDARAGGEVLGLPVLGDDDELPRLRAQGVADLFLGVGDNGARARLAAALGPLGFRFPAVVSPAAWVSPSAVVEAGALVLPMAVVHTRAHVGAFAIVNSGAVVEHDVAVGAFAHVGPRAALCGSVHVGARTLLGVGASVRPGVRIGDDVVVGAGAVVVGDLEEAGVYAGAPARRLR